MDSTPSPNQDAACLYAMQIASFAVLPMTLKAAVDLGLFDIITNAGPGAQLSPAEIAIGLRTDNPEAPVMLDRILRLLASYNILTCSVVMTGTGRVGRMYGVAPVVKFLTGSSDEDRVSGNALAIMNQDKVLMDSWHFLKNAVLEGTTENQDSELKFNKVFNEDVRKHSTMITVEKILETYKGFDDVNVLISIGGGTEETMDMILKKHPHVKGVNFDLQHVISEAPAIPGLEHIGGDMFESVPSGDAIFMKWILHEWSDEYCVKILRNCWKALSSDGKVIVVESVLPTYPEATTVTQGVIHADVFMLAHNPGGKERTEEEFESLAKEAGFSGVKTICSFANSWVLEFYK